MSHSRENLMREYQAELELSELESLLAPVCDQRTQEARILLAQILNNKS